MTTVSSHPRVAIGMPVYNGEQHLQDALSGILSQTFHDFELVICDNASTDRTSDIASAAAARDPRVRYIRHATNIGAAENFRFAVQKAVAPYFAWAAHDDIWDPRYLECLVPILDAKQRTVLAFSQFDNIDYRGARCATYAIDWNGIWRQPKIRQLATFLMLDPADTQKCNHIYGLVRRDVLLESDELFRYDAYAGSDFLHLYSLLCRGDFEVVEEVLFHYRVRDLFRAPAGSGASYLWDRVFGKMPGHRSNLVVATRRHVAMYRAGAEVILTRTPASLPVRLALATLSTARGLERFATQVPKYVARELRRPETARPG